MYKVVVKTKHESEERRQFQVNDLLEAKNVASFITTQIQFAFDIEYCRVIDENKKIVWEY